MALRSGYASGHKAVNEYYIFEAGENYFKGGLPVLVCHHTDYGVYFSFVAAQQFFGETLIAEEASEPPSMMQATPFTLTLLHSGSEADLSSPCTTLLYSIFSIRQASMAHSAFYLMFAGHNEMIIHTLVRKEHIGNIHMEHLHSCHIGDNFFAVILTAFIINDTHYLFCLFRIYYARNGRLLIACSQRSCYFGKRIAKHIGMVEIYRCDHTYNGIYNVSAVKKSAYTCFYNGNVYLLLIEIKQGYGAKYLKL